MEKSEAYEVAPLSTKNIKDFADKTGIAENLPR